MSMHGKTFWICFGAYAGFSIQKWKVTLGWVSLCFLNADVERVLYDMVERIDKLEADNG